MPDNALVFRRWRDEEEAERRPRFDGRQEPAPGVFKSWLPNFLLSSEVFLGNGFKKENLPLRK